MGEIVRGQDVTVEMFDLDSELINILEAQSFEVNMDSTEERQQRLGNRSEKPRQVLHGFSGTIEFEEEDSALDDLMDTLTARFLNGEEVYTMNIVQTVYYAQTGTSRTYVYPDCVFKINRSVTGKADAATLSLEWMSDFREKV